MAEEKLEIDERGYDQYGYRHPVPYTPPKYDPDRFNVRVVEAKKPSTNEELAEEVRRLRELIEDWRKRQSYPPTPWEPYPMPTYPWRPAYPPSPWDYTTTWCINKGD